MTIYSIKSPKKAITRLRHRASYDAYKANLTDEEFNAIMDALKKNITDFPVGEQKVAASYIPGDDWTNTPYQAIFGACKEDRAAARLFFGQLIWVAFQNDPEDWMFLRKKTETPDATEDDQALGVTYFKKKF